MPYLLNLVYLALLIAASPWLLYAAVRHGKYRRGLAARVLGRVPRRSGKRPCIWLHAVSVGEVQLLEPLLLEIEQACPDWDCVISTTTRTGYVLARRKYAPRMVFYCPLDFTWAVRRALRRIRPDVLLLAELEIWPNLLQLARQQGVRIGLVNGRLSARSLRGYRRLGPLVTRWLQCIEVLAVQNEEYARRFVQLGAAPERVRVTGSLKFDGAQTRRDNSETRRLAELWRVEPNAPVFLAGSTQEPEEALALDTFEQLREEFPELRLVLVPRHPERFDDVADLLNRRGVPWARRSRLTSGPASLRRAPVLLVDTVGELRAWWGLAQIAYVGGSMGTRGGQNMIEPAAYGAAISFGPHTENFRDVVQLLEARDAAVVVRDGQQLTAFVRECLADPQRAAARGGRARQLVLEQLGATARTVRHLETLWAAPPKLQPHAERLAG